VTEPVGLYIVETDERGLVNMPDKFFMGKPSQNYGFHRSMVSHNFTCSPT